MHQQLFDIFGVPPNPPARRAEITYPTVTPRPYQQQAVEDVYAAFETDTGCMIRQPTGTGKTIVGALIADRWLKQGPEYRTLVIAHERQLIWQFADELYDVLGEVAGIEMADSGVEADDIPPITVASRASLLERTDVDEETGEEVTWSRVHKFNLDYKWLVLWDEAHKHAYSLKSVQHIVDWFDQGPDNRRVGLTATPERTDKKTLERMFPAIGADYRLFDLAGGPCAVLDGYAVPYDQRFVTVEGVDFKNIRQIAGDFDQTELAGILDQQKVLASLCEPMKELVGDRKTLIFSVTREMAKNVAYYLNAKAGIEEGSDNKVAEWLDGTFPEADRRKVYEGHRMGKFQYLSVCGLCREGYNDPGIGAIAIFRPTKSRPLAEQMKGRGCRPLRGLVDGLETAEERRAAIAASAKPNCLIIDMVGATGLGDCATTAHIYAHGEPDDVIDRANEKIKDGDGPEEIRDAIEEAHQDLKREERERLAQIEARRRAKLEAEVKWKEEQVRAIGRDFTAGERQMGAVMPFGKHKYMLVADLPLKYLGWLFTVPELRPKLRKQVDAEMSHRLSQMSEGDRQRQMNYFQWLKRVNRK